MQALYIFLHIQKCAGTTFCFHILKNYRPEEILNLYRTQKLLCPAGGWDDLSSREEIEECLASLDEERKAQIKVIYGHLTYFGIHKYFDKMPRYIVFLRNPVDRMLSLYNAIMHRHHLGLLIHPKYVEAIYGAEGEPVDFVEFYRRLPQKNDMLDFIFEQDISQQPKKGEFDQADLDRAKRLLDEFYFVGITEFFNRDIPFLYHQLRIKNFFPNRNVKTKYYVDRKNPEIRRMIAESCPLDQALYDYALELNGAFRRRRRVSMFLVNNYIKLKRMAGLAKYAPQSKRSAGAS